METLNLLLSAWSLIVRRVHNHQLETLQLQGLHVLKTKSAWFVLQLVQGRLQMFGKPLQARLNFLSLLQHDHLFQLGTWLLIHCAE